MTVTIKPKKLSGRVRAIASKSIAHRLLIAAALSGHTVDVKCSDVSDDILATADSLNQLGAKIDYDDSDRAFRVIPINKSLLCGSATLNVRESGSTLRFLLPVICALGINSRIMMSGRLPERPLSPLWETLEDHGCRLTKNSDGSIGTQGKLRGGEFRIAANVSSQFISGLLFALPLTEEPLFIRLAGPVESKDYIQMTIQALELFGTRVISDNNVLTVSRISADPDAAPPRIVTVEGDWSNGAFWETAGMLSDADGGAVVCDGLDENSTQGDRAVRTLKKRIASGNSIIDARDIPDLVPVLSVLASVSPGTTIFTRAGRLRLKESDRIRSTVNMINALGGKAKKTDNGLIIYGVRRLAGGIIDSCGDHRIAMSAAVASIVCQNDVTVTGAESVSKSYPSFWDDFRKLGGCIDIH